MDEKKLNGLVASILNSRELVINLGSVHNVKTGMKFKIMEADVEIKDPVTKEILGRIQREKIRVKIVEVSEKLSIARTYETFEERYRFPNELLGGIYSGSPTKVKTLKASDNQAPYDPLDEYGSFVKIGDLAILIDES